jgi:hypothetical protein
MSLLSRAARAALESGEMFGRLSPRAEQLARAEALGFDTSKIWYHGTRANFPAFEARPGAYGRGVYVTRDQLKANNYANGYGDPEGANVIPVFLRRGRSAKTLDNDRIVADPRDVRSIFAAFDPARADSSDLLAAWLLGVPVGGGALYGAWNGRNGA